MVLVRNIREFVVAISRKLEENNWLYTSSFSNYTKVMTLSFSVRANNLPMYLKVEPSGQYTFKCSLFIGDENKFSFEASPNRDFENSLNSLLLQLKKSVGLED